MRVILYYVRKTTYIIIIIIHTRTSSFNSYTYYTYIRGAVYTIIAVTVIFIVHIRHIIYNITTDRGLRRRLPVPQTIYYYYYHYTFRLVYIRNTDGVYHSSDCRVMVPQRKKSGEIICRCGPIGIKCTYTSSLSR